MISALFLLFKIVGALAGNFQRMSAGLCLLLVFLGLGSETGQPWPHILQGPSCLATQTRSPWSLWTPGLPCPSEVSV